MTDLQVNAVHIINRYVYDLLLSNGAVSPRADYGGLTPIVPSQQIPELNQYNKPFLVYGFSEEPTQPIYFVRGGTVAYAIYSTDDKEITKIINIMTNALGRYDDTARDINDYKFANAAFKDTLFLSVNVSMVEGPSPADMEGGRRSGIVTVYYSFRNNYNVVIPTSMT